jgi:endonuclease YncB( thermonuclease family)
VIGLCVFIAIYVLAVANMAAADDLVGQASVVDGDTLEIHGNRIRLWGVMRPRVPALPSRG